MPVVQLHDIFESRVIADLIGEEVMQVQHWHADPVIAPADGAMIDFADALHAGYVASLLPLLNIQYGMKRTEVRRITTAVQLAPTPSNPMPYRFVYNEQAIHFAGAGDRGAVNDEALPSYAAGSVRFVASDPTRHYRGSTRQPGLSETDTVPEGNNMVPANRVALEDAIKTVLGSSYTVAGAAGSVTYKPVVLAGQLVAYPTPSTNVWVFVSDIINTRLHSTVTTQTSRRTKMAD